MSRRGICVIIPTFNNAGTVVDVVKRAKAFCNDVFVVVDGSTDGTLGKLEAMDEKPTVISFGKNRGKGKALREGFRAALEKGFSYAITLDADGQHYPEDIPAFLEANRKHPDAIVVGCRKGLEGMERSGGSKFANAFSNFWFFIQTLCPLKDTQSGYRLYPLKRLGCPGLLTSRYEAELELLVFSVWRGVPVESIEVGVYYPPKEERVSHFRPGRDFARIFVLNTVLCTLALVYALPRAVFRYLFLFLKTFVTFFAYLIAMVCFVIPFMAIYLAVGKLDGRKKANVHKLIYNTVRIARKALPQVSFTEVGKNPGAFDKPAVIICNHQSHLDLIYLLATTPRLVVLTADYVQSNPLYGFIIKAADFLPASRGCEELDKRLKELSEEGYSIAVYPEGTRSTDGSIGRFHQGAFYIADKLGLDILPIVTYGTGKVLRKHHYLLKKWPVYVEFDRRLGRSDMEKMGKTYKEQASAMRKYYERRLAEIADFTEKTLL